jgi:hypothetical protein
MHVVYICISVLMNYDCTTHFLSKYCITFNCSTWQRDEWLSLFQFYRKSFLRSVDTNQPKNLKFLLWSIIKTFPRGGAWLFRGSTKIRNDVHLPIPPFKIRPCDDGGDALVITSSKRYVLPKPPIFLLHNKKMSWIRLHT